MAPVVHYALLSRPYSSVMLLLQPRCNVMHASSPDAWY